MPHLTFEIPKLELWDVNTISREIAPSESAPMILQITRHASAGTYPVDSDMLAQALNLPTQAQNSEGDFNLFNLDESYPGLLQPTAMDYIPTTSTDSSSQKVNSAANEEFHDSGINSSSDPSPGEEDFVVLESDQLFMKNPLYANVYQPDFPPTFGAQIPPQSMSRDLSENSNDSGYASLDASPSLHDPNIFAADDTVSSGYEYHDGDLLDFTFRENQINDEIAQSYAFYLE